MPSHRRPHRLHTNGHADGCDDTIPLTDYTGVLLATPQDAIGEQARDMAKIADERVGGMKATSNSAHEAALVIETRLPEEIEAESGAAGVGVSVVAEDAAASGAVGAEGVEEGVDVEGGGVQQGGAEVGGAAPAASFVEGDASSEQPPQT